MLSTSRWQCSRCLGQQLRTAARPRIAARLQSTAATSTLPVDGPSPILLRRARIIAAEHATLSAENAKDYSVTTAKRIGEISPIASALKAYEEARASIVELESLLVDPSTDTELRDLTHSEIATLASSVPTLTTQLSTSLIPRHPFASMPCLIEIHPGAGGSEASLFAHTILSMYQSLCTRLNWPQTLTSYTPDSNLSESTPGITSAILEVSAPNSYNVLRTEAGVHRVQRVPTTEKKGRTHTSAVSVLVMPSFPEKPEESEHNYADPSSDYYIPPQDVRSETMRASGAGGQHVNKTDSAIRLTHVPTGIVVGMQESRSQHANRTKAWQVLRAKIAQKRREEREEEMLALRRKAMGGVARTGREDKVRTYNYSQSRVTDHRSGWQGMDLEGLLEGGESLEKCMQSVREWMDENEVKGLVAEEEAKASEVAEAKRA
ncbi:uncharacterized protein HMPREF1541_00820 [Cyphellophora europaea CBS 101466]|uniref:Prokaryotic-type class I peptide chain release factors domain-containing protein n=1 Tax=Cyphellophora europaea (strain CBS 101466) TaxID=1220924 RepID=W2SFE8_CYPE1|nr:uncharacterized protein HMPREF1541_00820 [Cyphellophora europaea CBS 101466]ETN46634.1 hypothetical protein HMPREF1541_00820 [Cyphellophora europaea CBS 101466]